MIRYSYIQNQVLQIYAALPEITYPLDAKQITGYIPNCRYMSYQDFAELNGCTLEDIIQICESKSGCTHYDLMNNHYLIMCNQSTNDNNNTGRQRWTCAHEIGHIVCKHHTQSAFEKLSENSLLQTSNAEYENEADYFAATLLAPFPILKYLGIKSASDIMNLCGLSAAASNFRFKEYMRWCRSHRKTAWENDMIALFKAKGNHL